MLTFGALVRWLHVVAVVIWVGGMFFMTAVLLPVLSRSCSQLEEWARLVEKTGRRFRTVSWEAVGVIVLTGLFNLIHEAAAGGGFGTAYVKVLSVKLAGVAGLIGLYVWQSVVLMPRLAAVAAGLQEGPASSDRLRRQVFVASVLFLMLAAGVILLGLSLRYV